MGERGGAPTRIADALRSFFGSRGLEKRMEQVEVVSRWSEFVGPQIASVTDARSVSEDGTLVVRVRTSAWMTELSLREPEIVALIRERAPGIKLSRIRWQIWHE